MCFPPPEELGPASSRLRPQAASATLHQPGISSLSSETICRACLEDKLVFLAHRRRISLESCERFLGEIDEAMRRETCAYAGESRFHIPPTGARRRSVTRRCTGCKCPPGNSDAPFEARHESEPARFDAEGAFSQGQRKELSRAGSLDAPSVPSSSSLLADMSYYERSRSTARRSTTCTTSRRSSARVARSISSSATSRGAQMLPAAASFSSPARKISM